MPFTASVPPLFARLVVKYARNADWSAAMFSDCPQPECDDFYAANVSGP